MSRTLSARAHPRSCGENLRRSAAKMRTPGLSPLTRGKPCGEGTPCVPEGLIPTHAGKTIRRAFRGRRSGAHPHSCGENMVSDGKVSLEDGSSPLTRGKPGVHNPEGAARGLIPAHAGKTRPCSSRPLTSRAHPRSRGENVAQTLGPGSLKGSSPLTRGKPPPASDTNRRGRLIPAHAGKTRLSGAPPTTRWAHPRSRGENPPPKRAQRHQEGSSPLTRGKQVGSGDGVGGGGLIPAHAGKTLNPALVSTRIWAHPRSRGENDLVAEFLTRRPGSSPLTRGKHLFIPAHMPMDGLIPAHAGKTGPTSLCPLTPRAHPRSRGENLRGRPH